MKPKSTAAVGRGWKQGVGRCIQYLSVKTPELLLEHETRCVYSVGRAGLFMERGNVYENCVHLQVGHRW